MIFLVVFTAVHMEIIIWKIKHTNDVRLTLVDPCRSDVFSVCHVDFDKANDVKQVKNKEFWNLSSK